MLPIIVYKLGTSLNINIPIITAKNILMYSKGAKNEGLEYFKAVNKQN